ncbi:MAG: cyclic nucleotide-binding domain-containing protein [Thermodesulfobacteriota bacterium]
MLMTLKTSFSETEGAETEMSAQEIVAEIKKCITDRDFIRADELREKLMESMALKESIEAAELIEEARLASMDKEHQAVWNELYEQLTPEEATVFYYSLKETVIPPKTVLIRQKQLSNQLFFVEEGQLAVFFRKDKQNHLVLQLAKGTFIGEDTFFGMSVCTSNIVSRSEVRLKTLDKAAINAWDEKTPGLYAKLESYCLKNSLYEEAFEQKIKDLNRFERIDVQGQVTCTILTPSGEKSSKQFRAELADISRGGACFFIKASKKDAVRPLLGRSLEMALLIKNDGRNIQLTATGRVVKINFHMETDYSLHIQFAKILEADKLKGLDES